MNKRFNGKLPMGMQVIFYPRADLESKEAFGAGPILGLVHRCDDGMCDLHVFQHNGRVDLKKNVYHKDHPDLYDAYGQRTGAAFDWGCWDFTEASKREWDRYHQPAIDERDAAVAAEKAKATEKAPKGQKITA